MEVLNEYRGQIIEAFWITIQLTVLSALGALILGTVVAAILVEDLHVSRRGTLGRRSQ